MPRLLKLDPDLVPPSIPRGWVRIKTRSLVVKGCRVYLFGRWHWCSTHVTPFVLTGAYTTYTYIRRAKR